MKSVHVRIFEKNLLERVPIFASENYSIHVRILQKNQKSIRMEVHIWKSAQKILFPNNEILYAIKQNVLQNGEIIIHWKVKIFTHLGTLHCPLLKFFVENGINYAWFVLNVLSVLQFVFHFFPRYEQKFVVGGAVNRKPYFEFFFWKWYLWIELDFCWMVLHLNNKNDQTQQSTTVLQKANLKIRNFSWNGTMLWTDVTHCSYVM